MDTQTTIVKLGASNTEVPLIKGENVTQEIFEKVQQSKKFKDWVNEYDTTGVIVKSIKIDYVFMFGPHVGFINLLVDTSTTSHNIRLPGNLFCKQHISN